MHDKQRQAIIYALQALAIVLLLTLFSTRTLDYYQLSTDGYRYYFFTARYTGTLLLYDNQESYFITCTGICLAIESCMYQAIWAIVAAVVVIILQYGKYSFLEKKFKSNPKGIHVFILLVLLFGALDTFSIPIYRIMKSEEGVHLLKPPILLETEVGILFTATWILEYQLMQKIEPKKDHFLQNQVTDQ